MHGAAKGDGVKRISDFARLPRLRDSNGGQGLGVLDFEISELNLRI